ncbi:hypothetical protein EV651_114108 [Kribbella sp. VKM Ac-2571]|uniref:hypothetical protein n=1 Tax=Kribbella sp. VKM Ac-2571 TaxID=2512222 RepID=UPI0010623117|nr:hypothetical protein [Kribbella sp. VKM Ac-2571]TDO55412.1 hypothetical protein EV651_114108 [Kribbella sp. VKM Ac-2571]
MPTAPWYENVYVPGPVNLAGVDALGGVLTGGRTGELLVATGVVGPGAVGAGAVGGGALVGDAVGALMTQPAHMTSTPVAATSFAPRHA